MKKHLFLFLVVILVIILAIVSFYMLFVHVPYYEYHHALDETRNQICETNHYEYMDYFYEYRSQETYYILKVKINGIESYVAYDQELNLVDTYQGDVANTDRVKQAIMDKYQYDVKDLEIGYENNKFVYYAKHQTKSVLMYMYYRLDNGEFVKAVRIEE